MSAKFLKAGFHNLGQVAPFILFGNADGLFDLSFLQAAGDRGGELAGLFTGLAESDVAIDHDTDRPGRHDGEQYNYRLGRHTHAAPHGPEIKTDLSLEKHHRGKKVELCKKHRIKILLNPVLAG